MIRTQEGYPLSAYHLANDRTDIVEAYKLRGYYFAQVPEPTDPEGNTGLDLDLSGASILLGIRGYFGGGNQQ